MRSVSADDVAGYGTSRHRRDLYLGAFLAMVAWLVLCRAALAIWTAERLAHALGGGFYNACLSANGMFPCLALAFATVALDVLLLTAAALVRTLRTDRPLAERLAAPAACAAALGLCAWWAGTRLDPLPDDAMLPLAGERTEYAAGYSADAFAEVAAGMSWEDVLASLGPPLDEGPYDGGYIVRYSRGIESSSYWRRVICYDRKGGTVRRVHTGLFVS